MRHSGRAEENSAATPWTGRYQCPDPVVRTQHLGRPEQVGLEPPNLSGWQYMREREEFHEFAW